MWRAQGHDWAERGESSCVRLARALLSSGCHISRVNYIEILSEMTDEICLVGPDVDLQVIHDTCDKAVMSRPQVALPSSPSTRVQNGSSVSASHTTFISPHLCGLRRNDLGLQPSQPSCHLRKDEGEGAVCREKREQWEGRGEEGSAMLLLSLRPSKQLFDMFLLGT